jgi:hypothetical protein
MIDPLGFALENFDAIGRYRQVEQETYVTGTPPDGVVPIDASGVLPDGTKFKDLSQFRDVLLRQPDRFVATLTENLLIYALGRGLEPYDMPSVRAIVREAASHQYRFSSLVVNVVKSLPFQMRRSLPGPAPTAATTGAVQ